MANVSKVSGLCRLCEKKKKRIMNPLTEVRSMKAGMKYCKFHFQCVVEFKGLAGHLCREEQQSFNGDRDLSQGKVRS